MKTTIHILLTVFLFSLISSCEKRDEEPPTITILNLNNNQSVFEIVTISCLATDNEAIEKVELWLDGIYSGIVDNSEPYQLEWNTTEYEDGTYIVTVRAYDVNGNKKDSESVNISVNNNLALPTPVNIISVSYTLSSMTVKWNKSEDSDFLSYALLTSDSQDGNKTELLTINDVNTITHSISDFNPTIENWFWIKVTDTFGYTRIGDGRSNSIDNLPTPSTIYPINYRNQSFQIKWSKNTDNDFDKYKLYESMTDNFDDAVNIFESETRTDTSHIVSGIQYDEFRYYWIETIDYWNLQNMNQSTRGSSYSKIAYTTNESALATMDIDGNNKQVLANSGNDIITLFPMFSPSGSQICFENRYNNISKSTIGTINVDGSNNREILSGDNEFYFFPHFSPDDNWLYYCNDKDAFGGEIYRIDINGNNRTNITNNSRADLFRPLTNHFTPDGNNIFFTSSQNNNREIYTMDLFGNNQTNISHNDADDSQPTISSSNKVSFVREINGYNDIFIMDFDGSNQSNISNSSDKSEYYPVFSPDGQNIAYVRENGLYENNIYGDNEILLAEIGDGISYPIYYPTGEKIIFEVYFQNNGTEIFIVNTDGSNLMNLTNNSNVNDQLPHIQPQP